MSLHHGSWHALQFGSCSAFRNGNQMTGQKDTSPSRPCLNISPMCNQWPTKDPRARHTAYVYIPLHSRSERSRNR
ncbi:unnamed protein product [Chondrus crispus]|uniref:Uncharacterized protein n=1 Tax=Chondrus crispus TaxID=2769 RepID=R7Q7Y7_CHOCR|nr:unnamed protein product [Chondrus crispus]CDF33580.1 unnamed protein product [Chondrus crispus]|eukprot:XP_005713383.1 unnamed protein product [Chondrus crispus]